MPSTLAGLVGQPAAPDQNSAQGNGSASDPGPADVSSPGLQQLLQQQALGQMTGQGGAPAGGLAPGGAPQQGKPQTPKPPTVQEAGAMFYHLITFQKEFLKILRDPDIGKKDIKGPIMDMMASTVAEGLVTLPQVMQQLKTLPSDPLAQRQWVEKHYANAKQASITILDHFGQNFPDTEIRPVVPFEAYRAMYHHLEDANDGKHQDIMQQMTARYGGGNQNG